MALALKYIILLLGFSCITVLLSGNNNANAIGIGIAAAGCLISFALIENNDVKESNKE